MKTKLERELEIEIAKLTRRRLRAKRQLTLLKLDKEIDRLIELKVKLTKPKDKVSKNEILKAGAYLAGIGLIIFAETFRDKIISSKAVGFTRKM